MPFVHNLTEQDQVSATALHPKAKDALGRDFHDQPYVFISKICCFSMGAYCAGGRLLIQVELCSLVCVFASFKQMMMMDAFVLCASYLIATFVLAKGFSLSYSTSTWSNTSASETLDSLEP